MQPNLKLKDYQRLALHTHCFETGHFAEQLKHPAKKLQALKIKENKTCGFSILELLVTMLLVAITVLGLMRLQSTLVHASIDNAQRSIGIFLGSEILDRIRTNTSGIETYDQALAQPDCASEPVVCDTAGNCSSQQVAQRDVWEVMCTGAANGISSLAMDLDCGTVGCAMQSSAVLNISWKENEASTTTVSNILLTTRL